EMVSRARTFLDDPFPQTVWQSVLSDYGAGAALNQVLTLWAEESPRPLVLLIDEIDSLVGDTLIAVLRQLRAGYDKRPTLFPQSVLLCGVRDVRDYRIHSSREKAIITGGSAFNVKAKSLRLGNFVQAEVETLYQQHTEETGQLFESAALGLVWDLTQGQPWLVNALGYEVCFEMRGGRDRSTTITAEMVMEAKERIILRRETHIDQLVDKLREERVRSVIEPILAGQVQPQQLAEDDVQYVEDLGLITTRGQLRIANKLYQEVIPRALTYTTQLTISHEPSWYIRENGRLDMDKLLAAREDLSRDADHGVGNVRR
ncbi:MAG: ATP-binding protein, partial [Anaerolineae bacterium]|nr:ATP-binding protein [Anaerolineae bacterium]